MKKIVIPISAFVINRKQKGVMKAVKMTLNNWINVSGTPKGRMATNTYKQMIQKRIKPIVEQEVVNGLSVSYPARFRFDWYLPDMRTDLDNWGFTHKFIFDAFQGVSVRGKEFMPDDNLKHVTATLDYFAGVDKDNPRVEITIIEEQEIG